MTAFKFFIMCLTCFGMLMSVTCISVALNALAFGHIEGFLIMLIFGLFNVLSTISLYRTEKRL